MTDTGLLLINLGTPKSPNPKDVHRYLIEFLTDERVIDLPWLRRQFLVRGVIVPRRYKQTAAAYRHIWTEEGSPLLVYGQRVQQAIQTKLPDYIIELGMRYQEPSIKEALHKIMRHSPKRLIILPLFPQYASATTGSVQQKVMQELSKYHYIPETTFISQFAADPAFVKAYCHVGKQYNLASYDHLLFSFHGLPARQLHKADRDRACLESSACCHAKMKPFCYKSQCHATMEAIASELKLPQSRYSICFQSRLGKEKWLEPYTNETIRKLAKEGCKKLLVFCPSFVCDCLETSFEIGFEYAEEFKHAGGKQLDLVRGLNDDPVWIDALIEISHRK